MSKPEVGRRVVLKPGHPWAGSSGTVVRWQGVMLWEEMGPRPVVQLDNGITCMITDLLKDWHYEISMPALAIAGRGMR